jgi:CBS domain containing-hemolysin-like protein
VASVAVEQRAATEVAQIVQPCSPTMTVDQGKPLSEVIERFSRHRQGRIFVVDGEQLVGVINSADVLNHMAIKLELQPHDETDDDGQASSQPTNSRAKEDQVSQAG